MGWAYFELLESTPDLAQGLWTQVMFSTGSNSVLATNGVLEATWTVSPADPKRFFRVLEAD